jgi:hypothetical protein
VATDRPIRTAKMVRPMRMIISYFVRTLNYESTNSHSIYGIQ